MTGWEKKILQAVRKVNPDDPIEYVRTLVKEDAREKLDKKLKICHLCTISDSTRTVTYGNTDAPIFVLTDSVLPSQNDGAECTYPLHNTKEWDLIRVTFQFYDIDISKCFFMNAVNCCPYLKLEQEILYRIPNVQEKESCKTYLDLALDIVRPKFMIILGNVALNSFIKANVDTIHGRLLDVRGVPTIATFSPQHLLRCQEQDEDAYKCEKNIFFTDFEKIKDAVKEYL